MPRLRHLPPLVPQTAAHLLNTSRISHAPPWLPVLQRHPPGETAHRVLPIDPQRPIKRSQLRRKNRSLFHPRQIRYLEDDLRTAFFGDHPWELARPRIVVERDGKDARMGRGVDWETGIKQKKVRLSGESVIQRQLHLLSLPKPTSPSDSTSIPRYTPSEAYDIARREFYEARLEEDVERRVAREEALYVGAYFGPNALEVGMQLEDQAYDEWRKWAEKEYEAKARVSRARYTGDEENDADEAAPADEQGKDGHTKK